MALQYTVGTTAVYSELRWLSKPKHVAADKLLIHLYLELYYVVFISSTICYIKILTYLLHGAESFLRS